MKTAVYIFFYPMDKKMFSTHIETLMNGVLENVMVCAQFSSKLPHAS